jgi:hypothetical protein
LRVPYTLRLTFRLPSGVPFRVQNSFPLVRLPMWAVPRKNSIHEHERQILSVKTAEISDGECWKVCCVVEEIGGRRSKHFGAALVNTMLFWRVGVADLCLSHRVRLRGYNDDASHRGAAWKQPSHLPMCSLELSCPPEGRRYFRRISKTIPVKCTTCVR